MKTTLFILLVLSGFIPCFSDLYGQDITTVAGTGVWGYNGDDIPATTAKLDNAPRIALDICGNLYIGDAVNNRVRRVDAITGIITTVAGTGVAGYNGDGIPATTAQLNEPIGLAFDNEGNLYIGDGNNDRIRKVDATTGIISTFAGTGVVGFSGDGGPATSAMIDLGDFAFDPFDNMYMCDLYRIRKIDTAGIITTIAGTGDTGVTLDGVPATSTNITTYPAINTDIHGNVFFVDGKGSIREVTVSTGIINRVAGTGTGIGSGYSGDGLLAVSCYMNPDGLYIDSAGDIYTACNTENRCIEIDTFGITHTVAGTGVEGFSGDTGPATDAKLWQPRDLKFDHYGHMYISDWENDRIRKVTYPYTGPVIANTNTVTPGDTMCIGTTVTCTDTETGGSGTISYQWYVNGVPVSSVGSSYTYTPANGDSIRCVATAANNCTSAVTSSNSIYMVVDTVTVPTVSITGPAAAAAGSVVTVNAVLAGAGSSYNINWYDNGGLFTTTTVPVVTYIKGAGVDDITATVVPMGVMCYDSSGSNMVSIMVSDVGVSNAAMAQVFIYPNPVRDVVHIDNAGEQMNYKVLSMVGSVLIHGVLKAGSNVVNVSELACGVYMVEVSDPSTSLRRTLKVVKE